MGMQVIMIMTLMVVDGPLKGRSRAISSKQAGGVWHVWA